MTLKKLKNANNLLESEIPKTTASWVLEEVNESDVAYRVYMDKTNKTEHSVDVIRTADPVKDDENAKLIASIPSLLWELKSLREEMKKKEEEIKDLKFMIDHKLTWEDRKNLKQPII